MMKRKTPQEKKALSYARDCRNTYGENDKSARKNIPLRKAKVNRGYRKKINQVLQQLSRDVDFEKAELIESSTRSIKREDWKKSADEPLGRVVERNLGRREDHAGNGKTARKKAREFVRNLKIKAKMVSDECWTAEAVEMKGVSARGETREKAIEKCRNLAEFVFLENLGAIKILRIDDHSTSILSY